MMNLPMTWCQYQILFFNGITPGQKCLPLSRPRRTKEEWLDWDGIEFNINYTGFDMLA